MVPNVSTLDDILLIVRERGGQVSGLIGVDGFMEAGKTTVAFQLAEELGGIRIGVDSYVDSDAVATKYVEMVRLKALERDLHRLRGCFPFVVLDGVCLLEVVDRVRASLDAHVYCKRLSPEGLWHDGVDLEEMDKGPAPSTEEWLRRDIFEYHRRRVPQECANAVFVRRETRSRGA